MNTSYGRITAILVVLFILSTACRLTPVIAEVVSSKELIENAKSFDRKSIKYRGEAVTAILKRGGGSWVNLHDGNRAIGVWCKDSTLDTIEYIGNYKNKGDIVEVDGIFNRACPVHGGELDIHAESVSIASRGFSVKERVSQKRIYLSAILFFIVLSLTAIFRKRI